MTLLRIFAVATLSSVGLWAHAAEKSPGVTATEIRIGNTAPYSGPASAYGAIGSTMSAYFRMINERGGVNGRKIKFISLDDAYSPPKTVEQTRRLVESDEVLAMVGQVGTAPSAAVQKYLNDRKIPQILVASGADRWDDPKNYFWSTSSAAPYTLEGKIFARYLLANSPNAKLGVLSANDDAGRDYVKGLKEGLGAQAGKIIVKELTYETADPTLDAQVVALKAANADAVFLMATPKFGAQAIRKIAELSWKPLTYVSSTTSAVNTALRPAGLENARGILSAFAYKLPDNPGWADDIDVLELAAFLRDWRPGANISDSGILTGYITAFLTTRILEACGADLSRANVIKQATNLTDVKAPLLLPGITFTTTPRIYRAIHRLRMARFDGQSWVMEGELISAD